MRRALALCALSTLSVAAYADEAPDRAEAPYFLVEGERGLESFPLKSTRARFSIGGVIGRVRLSQVYENHGDRTIEAVYVFPASTQAAVHAMRMRIGARTIEARIQEKAEAKRTYEDAKKQGKEAGLLEQHRPNVLQMKVANIRPGDRVEVEVEYTEMMSPVDGTYELVIPSVVGPRFTGESAEAEAWTANPHLAAGAPAPFTWAVSGKIFGGLPVAKISSPSHTLSPRFLGSNQVGIEVTDEAGGDRDFVLRYRLGGDAIETGLLLYPGKEEQFFLLNVAPPKRVAPTHIVPREYVFVVDVSGSMGGFPLNTAKKLLRRLVRGLRPQDRFNVVLFAGGSRVMSPQSVAATAENLELAEQVIDGMRGGGGTRLLSAMKRAFALPRDGGRSTSFVLVTDGYVSVEPAAMRLVAERLGQANLFTFGIGSSVNRHLIEGLARAGMGRPFVVLDAGEAATKAQDFLRYIEQPVLTDIQVSFDGLDVVDVEPEAFGDLFASRPITVFGKYRGQPAGRITVRGRSGTGEYVRTVSVGAGQASDDLGALAHLWARHRVARLSDLDAVGGAEAHASQITGLGLKYGLLTKYTSFVAVSKAPGGAGEAPTTVRQPLPMPRGVSNAAVGGNVLGGLKGSSMGAGGLGTRGTGYGGGGNAVRFSLGKMGRGRPARGHVKADSGAVMGALDKNIIARVIRRHQRAFRRVYERALKSNPKLSGKLVFRVVIGPDGRVKAAAITQNTMNDKSVANGLLKVLRRMRFPKPAGGGQVVITYPLVFHPS